jgi:hypothetical protein
MIDFADLTETRKLEPIKRRKSKEELLARDIESLRLAEAQVAAAKAKLLERGVAA